MVNFLQLLLLCCPVCPLCWLTGWISLLWGNEVVLWVGKVTCMDTKDALHICKHGGGIWEAEERCCTFLRLLGATCFSSHRPSSSWGCSHCEASLLATGRHISSLILCIFLNGLPLTVVYSLGLLFCQNTNQVLIVWVLVAFSLFGLVFSINHLIERRGATFFS